MDVVSRSKSAAYAEVQVASFVEKRLEVVKKSMEKKPLIHFFCDFSKHFL